MSKYSDMLELQMVASATLFYLTLQGKAADHGDSVRLRALKVTIDALEMTLGRGHDDGLQLAKNCCHTLRNFQPITELAVYSREIATILLRAALQYNDRTVRLTAINLCCHNLASLHPMYKTRIGIVQMDRGVVASYNVIGMVMQLIHVTRTTIDALDEDADPTQPAAALAVHVQERQDQMMMLEGCWTFLWNITDETPANADRFLAEEGLEALVDTLRTFDDHVSLRRNTMGLVTNLAEVPVLRPRLMRCGLVEEMVRCLHFYQQCSALGDAIRSQMPFCA
jgi:hypothetical protein